MQHVDDKSVLLESVIRAADVARIGIAISILRPTSSLCVYATDTAAALFGVRREQLVGHSLRDFLDPADIPPLTAAAQALVANPTGPGRVIEVTAVRADGERTALQLAHAPTVIAGEPAVVAFLIDVGEQRERERSVRETAERLAQILAQTPDAIVISRGDVILEANPAAAKMLGRSSPDALVGLPVARFLDAEDTHEMTARVARLAHGETVAPPRVYRITREDGVAFPVEIVAFASEYDGQPAVIAVGRDVTERERLQEQLVRAQRLAALGTLAAAVAHEINNPLAALALNIELVGRLTSRASMRDADRDDLARAMRELDVAVARMTGIVGELTGFSRSEPEQVGTVEVAVVVDNALRVSRHATRHRARVTCEVADGLMVRGDAAKLEQVMVNLVVNAAQAFPVERAERDNEIIVRAHVSSAGWVILEVSDNGVGIPGELVSRVFDPFFSTKPAGQGTGLGLFVCHNLVQRMGGEIAVESAPGRGAKFRVSLPGIATSVTAPVPAAPVTPAGARARLRVLVVDDEPAIRSSLEYLLSDRHEVTTASNGAEALQVIAADPRIDVIVCDFMMRGMSGRDVYERLLRDHPELARRMILMTGGAYTRELEAVLTATPVLRLAKPFTVEQLDAAIDEAVRHPTER